MSDEESFVILGSCSPGNSLALCTPESIRNGLKSLENNKIEQDSAANGNDTPEESLSNASENSTSTPKSTKVNDVDELASTSPTESLQAKLLNAQQEESVSDKSKDVTNTTAERSLDSNHSNSASGANPPDRSIGSAGSVNGSLAASFIMGEVNADVLKSSVYSQFPSLCSMESCAEDVIKLQNLMSEYIELKSTLAKVNAIMRQFYDKTQQWHEKMQQTEQQYKLQIQNCITQIAMLRNENLELKQEMENRIHQIQLADELKTKENSEMIKVISEKVALIDNLRSQIQALENQNLVSYEYVPKNENDTKQNPDYIARSEHLLALKEMERKLSELVAENMDLKQMKKRYVDEINCLKVNLVSAEELIEESRRDIETLKASDLDKSARFAEYESARDSMREEILVLREQVEVYYKDFQMERTARECLAGEKDQLIQDLRGLQRSNQRLIEDQKRYLDSVMQTNTATSTRSTSTASPNDTPRSDDNNGVANQPLPQPSPSNNRFHCPVCGVGYNSLSVLQSHVNSCLDNS